jgi:hypothetical protein
MAEAQNYTFGYREIAEALVKKLDIHEGLWGIYIEFALGAGMVPFGPSNNIAPAAIIPVQKIGIQRFEEPNALTVNAAEINPVSSQDPAPGGRAQGRRKRSR